jgi:hypothetical protein
MSSDYVSRKIHTSSDPGLQVKTPHPSALTLRCLSGSNNPVYSVLIRCFEIEFSSIKKASHIYLEASYLPDPHSYGTRWFGNGPIRWGFSEKPRAHRHQDEPGISPFVALRNENDAAAVGTITHPDKPDTRWRLEIILRGTMSKLLSGAHKLSEPLCGRCMIAFAIRIQVAVKYATVGCPSADHM